MIKKIEIAMIVILGILIIAILMSVNKNNDQNKILPQDVVYDFFADMFEGNFEYAMNTYLDEVKQNQLDALKKEEKFYKEHWSNYGIQLISENINKKDDTASVIIIVNKLNSEQIIKDVTTKLLNINPLKEDGTLITQEEVALLKEEYIKNAFKDGMDKYKIITNKYELELILDENENWKIINDNNISDILFGNKSNYVPEENGEV